MDKKRLVKILGGVALGVAAVALAPFTGGGSIIAGAGALGLGTTAALVGAGVLGVAGGSLVGYFTDDMKVFKLGLIGMKSSGKTTLLKNLGGVSEVKQNTLKSNYQSFVYKSISGKEIFIDKGKDIGGNVNFMADYKQIIEENDVIFYFFNINRYLTEIDYKRQCNMRLAFIYPCIENKKFALIGSHSDHSDFLKHELEEEVLNQISGKEYSKLFNNNLYVVNLTDDEEFKELIDKIFS